MAINLETLQIQFEIRDNTGSKLKKLQKQLAGMEDPEIDVNTQEAEQKIKELQKTAEDLEIEAEIDADTKDAQKKIDSLEKEAKSIEGGTVEIGGDKSEFDAVLKTVKGAAENIDAGSADIGGDKSGFDAVTESVQGSADDIDAGSADIGGDKSDFDAAVATIKGAADDIDAGSADIGGDKSNFESVTASIAGSADDIDAGSADIGGDKSNFDAVVATVKGAAEDINAGSADIGGDKSGFDSVTASVKGAADAIDAGSANIGGDKRGFDTAVASVKSSVGSLPNGSVDINANPQDAVADINTVTEMINDIPDAPEIKPKVDTTEAASGIKNIWNMMKAVGIVAAGQKTFEFAMGTVEAAYEGQSVENRIKNLGATEIEKMHALDRVYAFTSEMNEKYMLNETGLAGMVSDFTAAYKGQGQDLDEALDTAIQTVRYAIDYASALDKTPGEIGDIFMSVLKGQTEVADSAGIYGLTIDKLNQRIDQRMGIAALEEMEERTEEQNAQLEALKKERDQNIKLLQAEEFAAVIKENASITGLGYEGDFERTMNEFGNQRTILSEQWKTLKEDIGEFLTPAATEIINAMNGILKAVTDFSGKLGQSTFAKDVDGYFGTMEIDKTTMENAISHVTQPLAEMTTALDNANASLKTATDNMSASYQAFLKVLMISGTDNDLSNDMDEIEEAGEELANDALFSVTAGRVNMIERLNIFTGGLLEAETNAMYSIVDSYFDQAEEKVKQRKKEFDEAVAALKKENTPENLQQVKDKAFSMMQESYTLSAGYIGSDEYDWLRSTYKSGQLSAQTISEWMAGMNTASSEEQGKLNAEYEKARRDFVAIGQQVMNPETGALYTITELNEMFGAFAGEYTRSRQDEAKNRRLGFISEMVLGEYENAVLDVYDRLYKNEITGDEAAEQLSAMVGQLEESGLISEIVDTENKTLAMENLLELWAGILPFAKEGTSFEFATLPPTKEMHEWKDKLHAGGVYSFAREDFRETRGYDIGMRAAGLATLYAAIVRAGIEDNPYYKPSAPEFPEGDWRYYEYMFPDIGKYLVDPEKTYPPMWWESQSLPSFAGELSGALESIPDKIVVESHVYVGGYELGKATEEATITYNTSTGGAN